MTIGERIKKRRNELRLSADEVAKALGKNRATIYRYESNDIEKLPTEVLEPLARVLLTTPAALMGWSDDPEPSNISDIYTDLYRIPLFESASAGFGVTANSDIIDYIPLYIKNPAEAAQTIAIKVKGDSMYPKIEDGDIIIVRKQDSVDSGSIAVVLIDGDDGLVKRVKYGRDWIDLESINPEYKTRHFEGEEILRLRVVGLVRQIIKQI